jgi:hypothetical protein
MPRRRARAARRGANHVTRPRLCGHAGLADSEAGASPRGGALYPPRSVHPSSGPSPGGSHGNSQGTLGLPRSQPRSRRSSREISKDHIAPSRGAGGSSDSVLGPVSETSLRSSLDDQLADLPPLRAPPPKSPSLARASPLPEVGARASPVPEVGAGGATPPPCARFPRVVESSRKGLSAFSSEAQHERSDAGDGGGGTRALPPIFPQAGLDAAKP